MSKQLVTKAVFPVAGLGTRFLPATKANPKEMLPIVDKPLIQYAVEEALKAGITELIFVTSSAKRAIEDHFDRNIALEQALLEQHRIKVLEAVQNMIPSGVDCIYVRQPQALGLGHAVLCAQSVVGDHPFAVLLADDLMDATTPCMVQMVDLYQRFQSSVISVERIVPEDSEKYGVIQIPETFEEVGPIEGIVEKPKPEEAPSAFGVAGRYVLSSRIFKHLKSIPRGRNNELQLTDAIQSLLLEETVMALRFEGKRYDCGSKLGYMEAMMAYGLKHPEIGTQFRQKLHQLLEKETAKSV